MIKCNIKINYNNKKCINNSNNNKKKCMVTNNKTLLIFKTNRIIKKDIKMK